MRTGSLKAPLVSKQGKVVKFLQRGPDCIAQLDRLAQNLTLRKTLQSQNSNRHSGGVVVLQVFGDQATI